MFRIDFCPNNEDELIPSNLSLAQKMDHHTMSRPPTKLSVQERLSLMVLKGRERFEGAREGAK